MAKAAADRQADQATWMLAFAVTLHRNLVTLPAATGAVVARMGDATVGGCIPRQQHLRKP